MSDGVDIGGHFFPGEFLCEEKVFNFGTQEYETNSVWMHDPGITRRNWLAGLAMQALLTRCNVDNLTEINDEETIDWTPVASAAYRVADAMIAQGKKKPE